MTTTAPRVFISYSHDSAAHKERVLELSERLRADGIDTTLDQYIQESGPPEGWPRWMDEQIRTADFILVICTQTYRKRVEGRETPGHGRGVSWEANIVYQHIYNAASRNERFLPVLLEDATGDDIPTPLQGVASFQPIDDAGYEMLYRRLTGQPLVSRGELGKLRALPSRKIEVGSLPKRLPQLTQHARWPWIAAAVVLTIVVAAVVEWSRRMPNEYSVRVTVTDPQGRPVDNASVTSSLGGEPMRSDMGWQFIIPASSRPPDGKLMLRAVVPGAFQQGTAELQLGKASAMSATIELRAAPGVRVRGMVVDEAHEPVAGARVVVVGFDDHAETSADGAFSLPAHAADGQQVQVRARKDGYRVTDLWHPAGDTAAVLVLEKTR